MARLSAHRVAITNGERKVTGLITQSMVLSLLDQVSWRKGRRSMRNSDWLVAHSLASRLRLYF
jgi:hypothetical protein